MSLGRRIDSLTHRRTQSGFTLLELVTAMAVSLIILVALMESLGQASRSWTGQSKSFSEQREARTALRILADDLESIVPLPAVVTTVGETVLTQKRQQFLIIDSTDPHESTRLAFLRASRPSQSGAVVKEEGDVRLVMYAVSITSSGGASSFSNVGKTQKLLRRVLSPAETMRRLEKHSATGLAAVPPLIDEKDWAALSTEGNGVEVVADYVMRFKVRPYRSPPVHSATAQPIVNWDDEEMPTWVDLELRVTNRTTATLLSSVADWQGRGNLEHLLTNGTPEVADDDAEVLTLAMRMPLIVIRS